MGLDVFLYRYEGYEDQKKIATATKTIAERVWREESKGVDEETLYAKDKLEWKRIHAKVGRLYADAGLTEDGDPKGLEVSQKSAVYPEHMCTASYLRSSYNDGGMNRVVGNAIGKDLYWVFEPPKDAYAFKPDWKACLVRARQVRDEYAEHLKLGAFGVYRSVENLFGAPEEAPQDEGEALALFMAERARRAKDQALRDARGDKPDPMWDDCGYTNRVGMFTGKDAMRVVAVIPGTENVLRQGRPCAYLVFEKDEEDVAWYRQATEIVVEMCEWVLGQKDPDNYYLHWSS